MAKRRYTYEDSTDNNWGWGYKAHRDDGSYFATNTAGEGLFLISKGDVSQWVGTSDFRPRSFDSFKRYVREIGKLD